MILLEEGVDLVCLPDLKMECRVGWVILNPTRR